MTATIPAQRTGGMLAAARAEALFTSGLSALVPHSRAEITAAIRGAVLACHGTRGCACEVAREYGDHPETAPARMRWARQQVGAAYGPSASEVV